MSEKSQFRNEMAKIIVRNYSMKPEAQSVVEKWADWEWLFDMGYRKESAGQAYQEWLDNQ
ncbi:hypothetical protein PUATCC27989T_00462 [Phytobacter ursingii]|nr:hypothetical protein PUATCC27989T_00462 [Phytobacter ursingii]